MDKIAGQNIIEGNKLIAIFMGMEEVKDGSLRFGKNWHEVLDPSYQLYYNTEWNHLIPVVEKIESIHDEHHGYFGVHISSNSCSIQGTNLWKAIEEGSTYGPVYMSDPNAILETKIASTWYNVVAFIEWYNTHLKK